MPLLVVSPNLPEGTDSPSRKRSHEDFLGSDAKGDVARRPSEMMDIENRAAEEPHRGQTPPPRELSPDSTLSSPLSCSPVSLLTDAGSSSLTRVSPSPNPTPNRPNGALPELVISLDAMPASRIPPRDDATTADKTQTQTQTQTATRSDAQQPPPAKRKRLTAAEKEEKARADAARKLEKERQEAAKKQEKERLEAAKKQERDEKNAAAEAKKKALAEERERRNEEKERRRREKEEEERRVQEAKEKKERSQLRLNSFFRTPATAAAAAAAATTTTMMTTTTSTTTKMTSATAFTSPQKNALAVGRLASASPQKAGALSDAGAAGAAGAAGTGAAAAAPEPSAYDRLFKPFFVKENVVMATSLFGLDDGAKAAKAQNLDACLQRAEQPPRPFSHAAAVDYFQLPCCPCAQDAYKRRHARGRTRPTVRKVMDMLGESAHQTQAAAALGLLRTIPMKYLAFREDVRPPYYGTVTAVPADARLAKLARNPLARTVLPLSYDYDSEGEWVDDGDGEDVDDLDDDEELEPEEDEEMADFLDDSEDAGLLGGSGARPAFVAGGMEPESTGLCWENEQAKGPLGAMEAYRAEVILANCEGPIDPLSTAYWEVEEKKEKKEKREKKADAKKAMRPPPPTASDAFAALLGSNKEEGEEAAPAAAKAAGSADSHSNSTTTASTATTKKAVGVADEHIADLKRAVLQYAKLSKLGLVEMLSVEFVGKCTKSQIKASVEALAERTGTGQHKTWKLKEGR